MKRPKLRLPHPTTDKDKAFMAFLLEGVRAKRQQATAEPVIMKKEKPSEQRK